MIAMTTRSSISVKARSNVLFIFVPRATKPETQLAPGRKQRLSFGSGEKCKNQNGSTHQPNARWRQRFSFFRAGIRAKILIFTVAAQRRIYTGLSPFFQLRHDGKASKDNENITPFSFNNRNKPVGIFFDS